jgi:two-component system chemotaxis response regulator CheY
MRQCLIVDDSDVIRRVARQILEDLRFDVIEAESGRQAIDCCTAASPDVILLDWHMSDMGGIEMLQQLDANSLDPKPLIIYATTENDPSDISRALAAGADDYILKPFTRRELEVKFTSTSEFG